MNAIKDIFDPRPIFSALELKRGDTVYLASDITALYENGGTAGVHDMISCIQEMITDKGTLLIPTFTWDFCHGKGFDIKKTPSRTGALGRMVLGIPGFIRTRHPIYSFAAWGKDASMYASLDNISAFGPDSPFGVMTDNDAYLITFCVSYENSLTYQHHVEEMLGVQWRYMKEFTGPYTDENGVNTIRTYSMYVRDLAMDVHDIEGYDQWCADRFGTIELHINDCVIRKAYLKYIFKVFEKDIKENDGHGFVHYKNNASHDHLIHLIAGALEVPETEPITPETALDDLPEWDSLGKINVIDLIRAHTGRLVDYQALNAMKSVRDIIAVIERKER